MAVRFDVSGEYIRWTAKIPGDYVMMLWIKFYSFTSTYTFCFGQGDAATGGGQLLYVETASGKLAAFNNKASADLGSTVLSTGVWYHLCMSGNVGTGTAFTVYLNGVSEIAATSGAVANGGSNMFIGEDDIGTQGNLAVSAWKSYQTALTQARIANEMMYYRPLRTGSLYQWCPLLRHDALNDDSGSGRPFTDVAGGLSTEDGPPISWGPAPVEPILPIAVLAGGATRRMLLGVG